MKIRTQFVILSLLAVALTISLGVFTALQTQKLEEEVEENKIAGEIMKGTFEVNLLTSDYLLHPGERNREQWWTRHTSSEELLNSTTFGALEEQNILGKLKIEHETIHATFEKLTELIESRERGEAEDPTSLALEDRLVTEFLVESQAMLSDASRLMETSRAELSQLQQRTALLIQIFSITGAGFGILVLALLARGILGPLLSLKKGAEIIAAGNLKHRINIKSRDEIGALAQAFNKMVEGLSESIAAHKKAGWALGERMKELRAIYDTSRIMEGGSNLKESLDKVVKILPPAYQFPELACARVHFDGTEAKTKNFKKTKWGQSAKIQVGSKRIGLIEVFYLKKKPFLDEEASMLIEVAAQIGNIAERKRSEVEVRKAATYVEAMGETLMVLDGQRRVVELNKAGMELLGYTPKEVPSLTFEDVVPKKEHKKHFALMQQTIKEKQVEAFETLMLTKKGKEIPVLLSGTALKDDLGKITGLVGVIRDITQLKKVEAALRKEKVSVEKKVKERTHQLQTEQAKLLSSIESLPLGFFIIDNHHQIIALNNSLSDILEVEKSVLNFKKVAQLLKSGNVEAKNLCADCRRSKKTFEVGEVDYKQKVLRILSAPVVQDEQIIGSVVLVQNITDEKMLERSKDEFFSIASHELRTPLTAIRGNASLILEHFADKIEGNGELKEMVSDMRESSVRLIGIVQDFLDVSRLEQGRMVFEKEELDLSVLAEEVITELKSVAKEKGLSLTLDKPKTVLPKVLGDKGKVKQVIINLVGNAIKFTEKGSVKIGLGKEKGFVKLRVRDTGAGLAKQNKELLFKKFQQAGDKILTRDASKGTGLGLYISKLMIEGMGGKIYLESSLVGKGSTFVIELPTAKAKS